MIQWIKTEKDYYFDINTNKIYGPRNDTKSYWHEVSHYLDHKNKVYRNISYYLHQQNEANALVVLTFLIIGVCNPGFAWDSVLMGVGIIFLPYCLWSAQEEIRALINGYIWSTLKKSPSVKSKKLSSFGTNQKHL